MRDPYESPAPDGTIASGASRDRVPVEFEPVIADVVSRLDPQVTSSSIRSAPGAESCGDAAPLATPRPRHPLMSGAVGGLHATW